MPITSTTYSPSLVFNGFGGAGVTRDAGIGVPDVEGKPKATSTRNILSPVVATMVGVKTGIITARFGTYSGIVQGTPFSKLPGAVAWKLTADYGVAVPGTAGRVRREGVR